MVSLVGTWMQGLAMSWLVYRLTGSAFLLGSIGFLNSLPMLALGPVAGVMIDRWDRRKVLMTTQTLFACNAGILSALVLTNRIQVWHLFVITAISGLIMSFDMPTRQTFVADMVPDRADLMNAIALNSVLFNSTRLIGPAAAGFVVARVGEGLCFLLNSVSYLAVIAAFAGMTVAPPTERPAGHLAAQLREGLTYVRETHAIRTILMLVLITSFMGMSYQVLMPVVARDILRGDASTLGFLTSGVGLGAMVAGLRLASRTRAVGLEKQSVLGASLAGAGLIAIGLSRWFPVSLACMILTGFGFMTLNSANNTAIQTIVPDSRRGRVMSIYTTIFFGTNTFGSLFVGSLAQRFNAPVTLVVSGASCLCAGFLFSLHKADIRRALASAT